MTNPPLYCSERRRHMDPTESSRSYRISRPFSSKWRTVLAPRIGATMLLLSAIAPSTLAQSSNRLDELWLHNCEDNTTPGRAFSCEAWFTGEISETTYDNFLEIKSEANRNGKRISVVHVNSNGGDLAEALSLAKDIRQNEIAVSIPSASKCFSSCVFVLAGGVVRNPFGQVGIHRPYFTQGAASTEEARARFGELSLEIKAFFAEGAVRETLWDDMLQITPENIRILSWEEKVNAGLTGIDPAYEEKLARIKMQELGIDRATFNQRKALLNLCGRMPLVAQNKGAPPEELQACSNNIWSTGHPSPGRDCWRIQTRFLGIDNKPIETFTCSWPSQASASRQQPPRPQPAVINPAYVPPDIDNPHEKQCNDEYQRAVARIPSNIPIASASRLSIAATDALNACLNRRN